MRPLPLPAGPDPRAWARRIAWAAAAAIALAIAAGFAAPIDHGLDAVAAFRLHLALAAGALALLAGLLRAWGPALLAIAAAGAAAAALGPVWAPVVRPAERPGGLALTVLVANLEHENPDQSVAVPALLAAGADLMVTAGTSGALRDEPRLRAAYPHRLLHPRAAQTDIAIWSRWPLAEPRLLLGIRRAPRAAAAVVAPGPGQRVAILGAHLSRPLRWHQPAQVAALVQEAAGLPRPLIVAGDLNAPPWSETVRALAEGTGTLALGGFRATWAGRYPARLGALPEPFGHQIDHVLASPGIGIEGAETLAIPGSDHRALVVRLRLPGP